jgi:hypothetical protein
MSHNHSVKITESDALVPSHHLFNKLPLSGAIVGIVSLLLAFYFAKNNPDYFFFSFHVSWLFFLSITMGSIFFVLIQFATKAGWSIVVRRLAENVSMTMPLFALLFVVTIIGSHTLFHHWLSSESFSDKVISQKRWYLNLPFLYVRTAIYFVLFTLAAYFFANNSAKQDKNSNFAITYKLQTASYPFLILLGFCVTFFAFDWIMSLDPHWYSTIFGLYFFASCYMAFLALLSILTKMTHNISTMKKVITVEHYHDLGKLVFGHSCFWAYAAFAQYLLIWYGNIPEETLWYEVRQSHGWFAVWCLLCVGHFIVPFLFLMARRAKRSKNMVVFVSLWMLLMHFVDLYWLVMPVHYQEGPRFSFLVVLTMLGIGGLFFSLFASFTRRKAIIPIHDPRLSESMSYENV